MDPLVLQALGQSPHSPQLGGRGEAGDVQVVRLIFVVGGIVAEVDFADAVLEQRRDSNEAGGVAVAPKLKWGLAAEVELAGGGDALPDVERLLPSERLAKQHETTTRLGDVTLVLGEPGQASAASEPHPALASAGLGQRRPEF